MIKVATIILALMAAVPVAVPTHGYLSPATGAAVASANMGFFAAIYFTLRKYFHKIMRIFKRKDVSQENTPS
ncbi:MAG: hypothetical protein KIS81_07695 [Maricaulaceae bacterium]|nr:hypothetical protein [Maricaulaceae bacterium]